MRLSRNLCAFTALLTMACAHHGQTDPSAPQAPAALANQVPVPFTELIPVDAFPLRNPASPVELKAACDAAQAKADARIAAVIGTPDGKRTFANSFQAYDELQGIFGSETQPLAFMKDVHPDEKMRAAAAACEADSGKYLVRVGARKDLYLALKSYADRGRKTDALAPVDQRLIFLTLRDFRRNGLKLSDADRDTLVKERSRITELSTQFSANLEENKDFIEATRAELAGMPAAYIARLKKSPHGKYIITMKYPDYVPLMENARSEPVRKRAYAAYSARTAAANIPLMAEAVKLRDDSARLLGFATYEDYRTEDRMAKNGKTVEGFLAKLREELKPGLGALNQRMLQLKRAGTQSRGALLQSWDVAFYLNQIKRTDHQVDDEAIRAYFPSDKVLAGMFQLFSTVLHVSFREVANPAPWAPGVKLYEVHDAPGGRLLAKFFIDLFPRTGKYTHAASFPLVPGHEVAGGYQIPWVALVTNFEPPLPGKPSHLAERETTTLFHEFGHVMHECLTRSPFASLSGTAVDLDFVEAPSQMLENWVYEPEVLKLISEDPAHPGSPMPSALAKKLGAARNYDSAVRYTRQISLAMFDLRLHSSGNAVDPDGLERRVRREVMGYPVEPSEHFAAAFVHLMGGYDGGYYGYLWSQVFAEDMFTRFEHDGVLNPDTGRQYRDIILASGKTVEAEALLEKFLGRPPNEKAFLRLMGVTEQ